jgi:ankyrin repeat protein
MITRTQTRASSANPFLAAKRTAATLLEAAAKAEAAATLAVVSDDAAPSYSAVHADPRYATVYALLRAGVDVDAALSDAGDWPGQAPLHFALRTGDNELVRTLHPASALRWR